MEIRDCESGNFLVCWFYEMVLIDVIMILCKLIDDNGCYILGVIEYFVDEINYLDFDLCNVMD